MFAQSVGEVTVIVTTVSWWVRRYKETEARTAELYVDDGMIISRLDWQQGKIMALVFWMKCSGDSNELWPLYWNTNKSVEFILQGKCLKCWYSMAIPVHIPVHKSVRPLKNLDGQCCCTHLYSWSHTIRFFNCLALWKTACEDKT